MQYRIVSVRSTPRRLTARGFEQRVGMARTFYIGNNDMMAVYVGSIVQTLAGGLAMPSIDLALGLNTAQVTELLTALQAKVNVDDVVTVDVRLNHLHEVSDNTGTTLGTILGRFGKLQTLRLGETEARTDVGFDVLADIIKNLPPSATTLNAETLHFIEGPNCREIVFPERLSLQDIVLDGNAFKARSIQSMVNTVRSPVRRLYLSAAAGEDLRQTYTALTDRIDGHSGENQLPNLVDFKLNGEVSDVGVVNDFIDKAQANLSQLRRLALNFSGLSPHDRDAAFGRYAELIITHESMDHLDLFAGGELNLTPEAFGRATREINGVRDRTLHSVYMPDVAVGSSDEFRAFIQGFLSNSFENGALSIEAIGLSKTNFACLCATLKPGQFAILDLDGNPDIALVDPQDQGSIAKKLQGKATRLGLSGCNLTTKFANEITAALAAEMPAPKEVGILNLSGNLIDSFEQLATNLLGTNPGNAVTVGMLDLSGNTQTVRVVGPELIRLLVSQNVSHIKLPPLGREELGQLKNLLENARYLSGGRVIEVEFSFKDPSLWQDSDINTVVGAMEKSFIALKPQNLVELQPSQTAKFVSGVTAQMSFITETNQ